MYGVYIDGRDYVEPCLFETQAKSSGAGKKIYAYRPHNAEPLYAMFP